VKQTERPFTLIPIQFTIRSTLVTESRISLISKRNCWRAGKINVHPDPHGVVVNEFDGRVPGPLDPIDGD